MALAGFMADSDRHRAGVIGAAHLRKVTHAALAPRALVFGRDSFCAAGIGREPDKPLQFLQSAFALDDFRRVRNQSGISKRQPRSGRFAPSSPSVKFAFPLLGKPALDLGGGSVIGVALLIRQCLEIGTQSAQTTSCHQRGGAVSAGGLHAGKGSTEFVCCLERGVSRAIGQMGQPGSSSVGFSHSG